MIEQASQQTRLLLCSREDNSLLALQGAVFSGAGYSVAPAVADREIHDRIENDAFDIAVLNHTIPFAERKLLAQKIKTAKPGSGLLVLHHSGSLGNPYVDLAVDSRSGAPAVLRALNRVQNMLHARSHDPELDENAYVVVVDSGRHYIYASDAACQLLGYDRAMFLELRIDDVVEGATRVAEPLFHDFVSQGSQHGRISLRHRSGRAVTVNYSARVHADGCMVAHWQPLDAPAGEREPGAVTPSGA